MTLVKKRFEFYRKWFKTLLIKEFFNLDLANQEKFIVIVNNFIQDCQKIHAEAKEIMEKTVIVTITEILSPDNKDENYTVVGHPTTPFMEKIKIKYPSSVKKPSIGDSVPYTVYSLDGDIWYSFKEELLTGRKK